MNLPTILISLFLLAVVAAIIVKGVHNRRQGKSGCSCGCESCGACGACRPVSKNKTD